MKFSLFPAVILSLSLSAISFAGSAAWKLSPSDANWNNANNWTPVTIPNSTTDVATFGVSNITSITPQFQPFNDVAEMVFNPGASAYTINLSAQSWHFWGAGVTNNSGVTQNFTVSSGHFATFFGSSTAGSNVNYTVNSSGNGGLDFVDTSNAGSAIYTLVPPADMLLTSSASAADGVFENHGGTVSGQSGGVVNFGDMATAGSATITNEGGTVAGALGASTIFGNATTGGNATVIARGGAPGVGGGLIQFLGIADGGEARIELFDLGTLDISSIFRASVTIGSLEGNGQVLVGRKQLKIGSNNLSTTFSGTIVGLGGSVGKKGSANLSLSGANTYTGGTTVEGGTLFVQNLSGSGTGTGAVQVNRGGLGGNGTIAGTVTLSPTTGRSALLIPGTKQSLGALTIEKALTFNAGATYDFALNSNLGTADLVIANGVTIVSGAIFTAVDNGNTIRLAGTTFTPIRNTAATAINGTFSNLPDGGTITLGNNKYQVNYSGGDGNDLTLTVVP